MATKIQKAVIFAGGEGTRLSEYTSIQPKPLVEIGSDPVIVHVMRNFYAQGCREFIIAVGYLSNNFKSYFRDYAFNKRNATFTKYGFSIEDDDEAEDWTVRVVETGDKATTGQRLNAVRNYIGNCDFFLTYGDSVSNVDLTKVEDTLYANDDSIVTITAVNRSERFGILSLDEKTNKVSKFTEKSNSSQEMINGGFMACRNELLQEVNSETGDFSHDTLSRLADEGKMTYYHHPGFWHAMDTKKDVDNLTEMYQKNPESFVFGGKVSK